MQFQLDRKLNALYVSLREAPVAKTVEITDTIYYDIDDSGNLLGVEFLNADEFIPFIRNQGEGVPIPPQVLDLIGSRSLA
jgi:uncharacterized protein YuzE